MPNDPHAGAGDAMDQLRRSLRMTINDLWIRYFAMGGNAPVDQVEQWLTGARDPSASDLAYLAQAIDDEASDQGGNHPALDLGY